MNIAVIGTGAIGGYYGGRLAQAGHQVHFLARSEYDALREGGLRVNSVDGDFVIAQPLVYRDIEQMPPADLTLLSTKATGNDSLLGTLAPVALPGGAIVVLQNGLGTEERLAALYPESRIYAGLCFICSFREAPGVVRHTAHGRISFASLADDPAGVAELAQTFAAAGVAVEELADVLTARLRKLVWNIPYNGLSVVMDCTTTELATTAMRNSVRALMLEVVGAAAAAGITIPLSFVEAMEASTDSMGPYEPSMKLDYLARRPLEIEAIYSNVIDFAAQHGYQMGATALLRDQLTYIQSRYL